MAEDYSTEIRNGLEGGSAVSPAATAPANNTGITAQVNQQAATTPATTPVATTTTNTKTSTVQGITGNAQTSYPNAGINNQYLSDYMQALGGGVDHSQDINNMYQGLRDSQLAQLEAANQINQSNLEANRQDLLNTYRQQQNAQAIDYERNRYNLNQQAASNGLNVGTGSQMGLALNNAYQQADATIRAAQVKAESELNRQISNLNIQYQADVAAAIADNDYQKAAALYQDKLNREQQMQQYYKMMTEEMNTRASYGDFGMMAELYGTDAANTAKWVWATQNPRAAYDQGAITPEEYYNITGEWPRGYTPAGSGGGGTGNFADSWYGSRAASYKAAVAAGDSRVYNNGKPISLATYLKGSH